MDGEPEAQVDVSECRAQTSGITRNKETYWE